MKKLFVNGSGKIVLKDIREPFLAIKGSLVATRYALISSGTEILAIKSRRFANLPLIKKIMISKDFRKKIIAEIKRNTFKQIIQITKNFFPRFTNKNFSAPNNLTPLGYSCSGIVLKSNLEDYNIKDQVSCAGLNHAEMVFSPKNLTCKVPDNVSLEEAAFTTIGAIALHSIHRADIKPGANVGVIGTGLIGLIAIQLARINGARVFAFDLIDKRLRLAKKLGADFIINSRYYSHEMLIDKYTQGHGLDSIIICASSKSPKPLEDAVDLIRDNGKIVILGSFPININRSKLYYKEPDLLISRSYGPGRYDYSYEFEGIDYPESQVPWTENRNMNLFLKLLSEKKINIRPLISEIIPVSKARVAYEKLEMDPNNNIAILLDFSEEKEKNITFQTQEKLKEENQKLIIGLIGCGSFAQNVHLPILLNHPKCKVKAICTKTKDSANFCKQHYRPEFVTTNYKEILNDPEINTVFIYTRHDSHGKFTIEALESHKNVYTEKPMALTMAECEEVYDFVKKQNKHYMIGFNRRYSPFIKKVKDLLKNRNNPIILNYRIANPFLSGTHWLFDPKIGGGPIVGECCHFTDLILYLINSTPIEVIARGGSLSHKKLDIYDTFASIIKFKNGSIANLIYSDLSTSETPKERIEIFSGESSIIIDDFLKITTSGFDLGTYILPIPDKGHETELNNVIRCNLGQKKSLVGVDDAFNAMKIVFQIIKSIKTNKAIKI